MKIVRFSIDSKVKYGILNGKSVQCIEDKPFRHIKPIDQHYKLDEIKILAPCTPSKIVTLGLNYYGHAKEMNAPIPDAPLIFLKPSTSIIGPEDNIVYPSASSRVDYQCELAAVIEKPTWRVSTEDALDYVLGYTCFNDVTARDSQYHNNQRTRAKSYNTFAAVGPCIETKLDPGNAQVETYLNGELKQRGNTNDLIYNLPELINFISHVMSLLPGDIIATGTPSGIGPMYAGDTVEIKIKGIGTLKNYVIGSHV